MSQLNSMPIKKPHLWQGEWIDDQDLEERLRSLPRVVDYSLTHPLSLDTLLATADAASRQLRKKTPWQQRLAQCLLDHEVCTAEEVMAVCEEIAWALSRERLISKMKRELKTAKPFQMGRIDCKPEEGPIFESYSPLGLLVHISPQNAFAVGVMSVIEGLLTGNCNVLKTGKEEPLFAQLFFEGFLSCDRTGTVKDFVIAARISSRNEPLLKNLFHHADGIAVWGGDETLRSVRAMAPQSAKMIGWGHRMSFAYVTEAYAHDPKTLEELVRECCYLEQQACSSPQCIYVDMSDWAQIMAFAKALAAKFAEIAPLIPRKEPDLNAAAEITMVQTCHELETCYQTAALFTDAQNSWRIFVDQRPSLIPSPLYRSVWLKPLPKEQIVEVLRPMRQYLQTVGLAATLHEIPDYSRLLIAAGVTRVRQIGAMTQSYSGEPHDGVYALSQYMRRVSVAMPSLAEGVSSFEELDAITLPAELSTLPVCTKESFTESHEDESTAQLYFKSGGSTGAPKLATYSYEQYDEQMQLGAEGFLAAGLDPHCDRAINLFYAGGLYGGFISVFSALERLKVVQLPMTAHPDLAQVAALIISQRVNVLLGMPTYLFALLHAHEEALARYGGINKIFYGGEHVTASQRSYLKQRFGIDIVRSGAYGSVDIGPMAYQCPHCVDGEHHVQQKLHYMEILKLDEDKPVLGNEVGRLVFTPRDLFSHKPKRYAIGDIGHWVKDPMGICSCGRKAPRFKLLGRMGDIFRIATAFLNLQRIEAVLSQECSYIAPLQLVLSEALHREKLTIMLAREHTTKDVELMRQMLLSHYADLYEVVEKEPLMDFEVVLIPETEFMRSSASGKLLRIIDKRR